MRHLCLASFVGLILFSAACHHGGQNATQSVAANSEAATNPCRATVKRMDVSAWREVATTQFTFCVPADWLVREDGAVHGSSEIEWGRGSPPNKVIGTSIVQIPAGGGATGRGLSDRDMQRFSEDIGGYHAQLWKNRFGSRYYTGARWESPAVWLTGEATIPRAAEIQLAIFRTVRFDQ